MRGVCGTTLSTPLKRPRSQTLPPRSRSVSSTLSSWEARRPPAPPPPPSSVAHFPAPLPLQPCAPPPSACPLPPRALPLPSPLRGPLSLPTASAALSLCSLRVVSLLFISFSVH